MKKNLFIVFVLCTYLVKSQCGWYNTNTACTSNAPTVVGNSISCSPPSNNGGRRNFVVDNMQVGCTYRISNCGSGFDTQLTVRDAGGNVVGYNDDNGPACSGTSGPASLDFTPTTSGTYYIQLNRYNCSTTNQTSGSITVTLMGCVVPPSNDDPCNAIALSTTTAACSYTTFTNANAGASSGVPAPGCANYQGGDVWFKVTVPSSGVVNIDTDEGVMTDGGIAVYSGSCGSLTLIECDDDDSQNGTMPAINLFGQTAGATLWVRVWERGNNNNGTFGICVTTIANAPPVNCTGGITLCNSQAVPGNAFGFGTQELSATNRGCLSTNEHQSSWYAFAASSTGNLGLTIVPGGNIDYDWAIWGPYASGSTLSSICPPNSAPIRCSYASGGTTYLSTGSYNTGMGNNSWETSPAYAAPGTTNTDGTSPDSGLNGWTRGIAATTGQVYLLVVDNFTSDGTPFTLSWNLAGGASLDCSTLGFELLSFKGFNVNHTNELYWTTASETDSYEFIIERSANGFEFETIGTLPGAGNSNTLKDYKFTDVNPLNGINYYRLKQNDSKGPAFSSVIAIENNVKSVAKVSPNPSRASETKINLVSNYTTSFSIKITDCFGRVVANFNATVEENIGKTFFVNDFVTLTNGIYALNIYDIDNKSILSEKLLIVE